MSVLLRVKPDRRPDAEQLLSIPSILPYVQEYTSRNSSSVNHASVSSEVSLNRKDSVCSISTPSIDKSRSRCRVQGTDVADTGTVAPKRTFVTRPSSSISQIAKSSLQSGSSYAAVATNHSPLSKECGKGPLEDEVFEKAKENVPESVTLRALNRRSISKTSSRKNEMMKNRKENTRHLSDAHESRRSKRKHAEERLKTNASVSSSNDIRRLDSRNDDNKDVFTKEGVQTVVKRRKYSCLTPVAPNMIQGLRTPRSVNLRKGSRSTREQSPDASPIRKLFSKHPLEPANNDRKDQALHSAVNNRTRVIKTLMAPKETSISQTPVVKEKLPRRQLPTSVSDNICGGEVVDSNISEQPHQECGDDVKAHKVPPNRDDWKLPAVTDSSRLPGAKYVRTSVSKHSKDRNGGNQHREVCEMLLACTPYCNTATNGQDDVQTKLELLKMFLERRLGNQDAVLAFQILAEMMADGRQPGDIVSELEEFLPSKVIVYIPLLIHVRYLEEWSTRTI